MTLHTLVTQSFAPLRFACSAGRGYGVKSFALSSSLQPLQARRWYSDGKTATTAVELSYDVHEPPAGAEKSAQTDAKAVVYCHGLFGSKQNWRSIARATAKRLGVPVYAVDLRNHGRSPHASSMRYDEMASDLRKFFSDHSITDAALVGHSMGGKTVQSMALDKDLPTDAIRYLISVDMSPARGPLSEEFKQYIEAMLEIEDSQCKSRKDADAILQKVEPAEGVRQFLLTNLTQKEGDKGDWTFRIPVRTIQSCLHQIGDFPYNDEKSLIKILNEEQEQYAKRKWDGQTLFVKGEQSKYINRRNIPICDAFFPNAKHITLNTGHWVQAERPTEFVDELVKFVQSK